MNKRVKQNRMRTVNSWRHNTKSNRGEVVGNFIYVHNRQGIFTYLLSKVCLHRCSGLSIGMAKAVSTRVVRLDKPSEEGKWFWVRWLLTKKRRYVVKRSVLLTLIASLLLSGSAMATTTTQRSISLTVNVPSREHSTASVSSVEIYKVSSDGNGNWRAAQRVDSIVYDSSNLIYDETEPGYLATAYYYINVKLDNYEEGNWGLTVKGDGLDGISDYIDVVITSVDRTTENDNGTLASEKFRDDFKKTGHLFTKDKISDGFLRIYCSPKVKGLNYDGSNISAQAIPGRLEGQSFTGTITVSLVAN